MVFNKKIKQELQETKNMLTQTENELSELKEFISFFKNRAKALALIKDAEKECYSNDDFVRLNYLKKTITQANYRDFITKTQNGKICIDIHQMTVDDYQID